MRDKQQLGRVYLYGGQQGVEPDMEILASWLDWVQEHTHSCQQQLGQGNRIIFLMPWVWTVTFELVWVLSLYAVIKPCAMGLTHPKTKGWRQFFIYSSGTSKTWLSPAHSTQKSTCSSSASASCREGLHHSKHLFLIASKQDICVFLTHSSYSSFLSIAVCNLITLRSAYAAYATLLTFSTIITTDKRASAEQPGGFKPSCYLTLLWVSLHDMWLTH